MIILLIIFGILFGIFTGLVPGLHTNLVSVILITLSPFLLQHFSPLNLTIFIVAMSITNLFIEFIPATYLGAPDEDSALSVMPAHELLLEGKANTAIFLSSSGGFLGSLLLIILAPLMIIFLSSIYSFFEKMMFFVLIWISIFMIYTTDKKILTTIFFFLSGFFGIGALNLDINQSLLPLLTGLFGISGIIYSIGENAIVPEQEAKIDKPKNKEYIKPIISGLLISPVCSFLPGLGSSQATIISSKVFKETSRKQFLILNGIINAIIMGLSFVGLFTIQKARTGSASAISNIMTLTQSDVIMIISLIIAISIFDFFLAIFISRKIAKIINKINYRKLSYTILIFLIIIVTVISGWKGILVTIVGTCLGLSCQYYGIRKGILMGCLLIPTIIFYIPG
jgi:putative membrane protein